MKVIFRADQKERVREVFWVDEDGCVSHRHLDGDGDLNTHKLEGMDGACKSLMDVFHEQGGTMANFYPTEVDDLRSAFKYLGKAFDLVQTLPELEIANIDPEYTRPAS